MTTQRFNINTVKRSETPLVEFTKKIIFRGKEKTIEKGLNHTTIDIHEIETFDGIFYPIREYCNLIDLVLDPEWVSPYSIEILKDLVFEDEAIVDAVQLIVYLLCPATKEIISLKKFSINAIEGREEIVFKDIDLNDFKEKIEVHSNISRVKGHSVSDQLIADKKYFILNENKVISIYIDEVEAPGGDHLDIRSEDIGKYLFKLQDWQDDPYNHPTFFYNSNFEKYIKGGDYYNSVKLFLMMSLVIFAEDNLKWILFGRNFNETDEYHRSVQEFLLKILDMKKSEFDEIIDIDNIEEKVTKYIELSQLLVDKIQVFNVSYKTLFKNFIDMELKTD